MAVGAEARFDRLEQLAEGAALELERLGEAERGDGNGARRPAGPPDIDVRPGSRVFGGAPRVASGADALGTG